MMTTTWLSDEVEISVITEWEGTETAEEFAVRHYAAVTAKQVNFPVDRDDETP